MINTTELMKIGLSQKEADLYLALLEMGMADAPTLSSRSQVNRTTTYVILDALCKKGVASVFERNGKQCYVAESPNTLKGLIEDRQQQVHDMSLHYQKILPSLLGLFNLQERKPVVRYYEGEDAVQNLRKHIMTMKDGHLYGLVPLSLSQQSSEKNMKRMKQTRLKLKEQGVDMRVIFSAKEEEMKQYDSGQIISYLEHISGRVIPFEKLPIENEINIFDDKMIMANIHEGVPYGVMIVDPRIVSSFKTFFTLAWEQAASYDMINK